MIPGSPSPISTPRGMPPQIRAATPPAGARPASGAQTLSEPGATRQATAGSFRGKSPGVGHSGGKSTGVTAEALTQGIGSKAASQIGGKASRMSGSAVQSFMGGVQPSSDGSGGRLTDNRIGMIARSYANDGVDLVKGIEKNILAGNEPLDGIKTRMDPRAIDKIVKQIVKDHQTPEHLTFDAPSPSLGGAHEQPRAGRGARSSLVSGDASDTPSAFSPSPTALASAERRRNSFGLDTSTAALKRATEFLELSSDPEIMGAGLNAGEYGLIGASSGVNCHAYALNGDQSAPRSVADLRARSDGRVMVVCIEGGKVLHTAFLNKNGLWEQALKDDMGGGHTAVLETNSDVLRSMYKNGVVLMDTEGSLTQTAWTQAVRDTKPKE